jgi:glycosyltransferase involved in cell wall biosynthesis
MKDFILLDFPIEPMDDRYSAQWIGWFCGAYERNGIDYTSISGTGSQYVSPSLGKDKFLDPSRTFHWKFNQLKRAIEILYRLKNKTVVCFLQDGWFPGIESLKYVARIENIPLRIVSFWHAGSYSSSDLLGLMGLHKWFKGSEQTWFGLSDVVCVGSEYHKRIILSSLGQSDGDVDKVYVTGCPIEVIPSLVQKHREKIVVWPHRVAEDKHPEIWDRIVKDCKGNGFEMIRTKDLGLPKKEYYGLLGRAKVAISTATHEHFGISMIESGMMGCFCLVPDSLSYKETMPRNWRYKSYDDLLSKLDWMLSDECKPTYYETWDHFQNCKVTDRICSIISEVANG